MDLYPTFKRPIILSLEDYLLIRQWNNTQYQIKQIHKQIYNVWKLENQ